MIDLGQSGYSHEEIVRLLATPQGLRDRRYAVEVVREGICIGRLRTTDCMLECAAGSDVKHYGRFVVEHDERFDWRRDQLRPVMSLEHGGALLRFPFVPLVPVTQALRVRDGVTLVELEAYDETVRLQENSLGYVPYFPRGTLYTAAVAQLLDAAGVTGFDLERSELALGSEREDWAEDDGVLGVVNGLLEEMGYGSLHVDRDGVFVAQRHREPGAALARIRYQAGAQSVVFRDKTVERDGYKRPNRFVGVVFGPEREQPLRCEYVNDDPSLPSSVANTGWVRTEVLRYDEVADEQTLRDNVLRRAQEVAASHEYVRLDTAIMPHHEPGEVLAVRAEGVDGIYEETGWSIDRFAPGGRMRHSLRRAVYD